MLHNRQMVLVFARATGRIQQWTYDKWPVLLAGPALNLWRAPTDNDRVRLAAQWAGAGLDRLAESLVAIEATRLAPDRMRVAVETVAAPPGGATVARVNAVYVVSGNGEIMLNYDITLSPLVMELPRVGLMLTLPGGYEAYSWYGRGPHETYRDRQRGGRIDVYHTTVDADYVPYIRPQAYGNKTDVRWVALRAAAGAGLLAVVEDSALGMTPPVMEVSASHLAAHELASAAHTCELARCAEIFLCLDIAQAGLGSETCGPGVLPQYQLNAARYAFQVRLSALTSTSDLFYLSRRRMVL